MALSDLGIGAELERLYRALLAHSARGPQPGTVVPSSSATDQASGRAEAIATELGQPLAEVQAGCDQLVALGVLKPDPADPAGSDRQVPEPGPGRLDLDRQCRQRGAAGQQADPGHRR